MDREPPHPGQSDDDFVRRIYAEHGAALLGYARWRLRGEDALAQDALQETLLRAWRRRAEIEGDRPIRGWLITVLHNVLVDQHRAAKVRPQMVGEPRDDAVRTDSHDDGVAHDVDAAAAVASLPSDLREVLLLLHYQERTVAEAAAVLGVTERTVHRRYGRAKLALAQALGLRPRKREPQ
jgi:RNA polymerase sigma-70 factor, ECF subfamily